MGEEEANSMVMRERFMVSHKDPRSALGFGNGERSRRRKMKSLELRT
ncbi:hypothetical protein DsansV1_C48g0243131 [Dioscorea sansibarensis]